MLNRSSVFLEAPSEANGWMWVCHGLGMKLYEPDEAKARWKLRCLAVASVGEQDRPQH